MRAMIGMKQTLIRVLVPVCLLAGAGACHDLVNLDEQPLTFIDPANFFKTAPQAIEAVNGMYAPLMKWDDWISPAWRDVACEEPDVYCPGWAPTFVILSAHHGSMFKGRNLTSYILVV